MPYSARCSAASTCMKALSAQQALDEASRTHFDVVFLDIEMPGMNGI